MFKDAEMMAIKIFICLCAFHLATAYDKLSPKYITEFITPFDLPVNDLRVAVANQLSRNDFKTPSFTTDNVKVSNLIYKSKYNGTDRVVDPKYAPNYLENSHIIMMFPTIASILRWPIKPQFTHFYLLKRHITALQHSKY